jgi:hypothetical protein
LYSVVSKTPWCILPMKAVERERGTGTLSLERFDIESLIQIPGPVPQSMSAPFVSQQ